MLNSAYRGAVYSARGLSGHLAKKRSSGPIASRLVRLKTRRFASSAPVKKSSNFKLKLAGGVLGLGQSKPRKKNKKIKWFHHDLMIDFLLFRCRILGNKANQGSKRD